MNRRAGGWSELGAGHIQPQKGIIHHWGRCWEKAGAFAVPRAGMKSSRFLAWVREHWTVPVTPVLLEPAVRAHKHLYLPRGLREGRIPLHPEVPEKEAVNYC